MKLHPTQEPVRKAAVYEEETGFSENWSAALGLTISEDLPVISRMVSTTTESRRKKQINDYVQSGEIPYSAAMFYGDDYSGMAGYARDTLGLDGFVTDEEYEENRVGEYKVLRDYSQDIFARQSGMGVIGQMAGIAHAMAVDPIYATSFLTGYGGAATAGQAFLRVGAIEAGIEAVAQVPKMSFKEDIQSEHSGAQAITEIAFAGLGAGALAALGKTLGRLFTPKDLTVGQATEVLVRMEKTNPEMAPVINTLKHADPEENLAKVLEADEAIDIRRATEGPLRVDEKSASELKAEEHFQVEEEVYLKRQPVKIEVGDRVNLAERTSVEKTAQYSGEAKQASKKVKKATKKYNKAKERAAALSKAAKEGDESVAGKKALESSERADKALVEAEANLAKATEAESAAKALSDEAVKTAEKEGVPRGTPKEPEPDLRHPMVKEADAGVARIDDTIKTMEDCF